MLEEIDPSTIEDQADRQKVVTLLNQLEEALQQIKLLQAEVQRLRDENNRLKGEQGKPDILPKNKNKNYSSEKERHQPEKSNKGPKQAQLVVTRTEKLTLDLTKLPSDVQFKGYEEVLVQDVIFQAEVICFRKEKYYSPSERQSYLAPLPQGYSGQFGPRIKALVLDLYYQSQLSEPKILELLTTFGMHLSSGEISSWLTEEHQALFEAEKLEIVRAGLESTSYQHFDHTGTRALGENRACHILCNPYYTAFFTLEHRDRLSVLRVLLGDKEPTYCYNEMAEDLLQKFRVAQKWRKRLKHLGVGRVWNEKELKKWVLEHLEEGKGKGIGERVLKLVYDALAIASYHAQSEWPIVRTLVCDDAPQFNHLTLELMLCWVHQARPFKKLEPKLEYHRKILSGFLSQLWCYYDQLLLYTQKPEESQAAWLSQRFDELFKPGGEYLQLDDQILKVKANKAQLLLVLSEPYLPLHNNPAELGARQRVRKLDVSLSVLSKAGLKAWDCFQTIFVTAKKLGINGYDYVLDRVSGKKALPSLASVIIQKGQAGGFSYYPSERAQKVSAKHRIEKGQGGGRKNPIQVDSQSPPELSGIEASKKEHPVKVVASPKIEPLKQVMAF